MSDEFDKPLRGDDPFVDPSDPAAVERAERRREREAKRAQKSAKKKNAAPPPPPPKEAPAAPPRTPEQEFWDEPGEPTTPPPGQGPVAAPAAPDPERGRRRLPRRRKPKGAAAAGAAAAAAGGPPAPQDPPTSEAPAPKGPPTTEAPIPQAPPTTEASVPQAPPTTEAPVPPAAPTTEQRRPEPIPPQTEAPRQPTAEAPRPDPGPRTAEAPRPDPNQPTASSAVAGEMATGERRALPPRPMEQAGAGDWEPPPPRDDWFDDHDFHDEGDPEMTGAARSGGRHGEDGGRRGGLFGALLRHPFRILAVVVAILVLLFLNSLFQPFHGDGHGHVAVVIPKGSSVGEVGDLLENKGVISGGFLVSGSTLFQARVTLSGKRSDLYAGKFVMAKDMSYGAAIDQLSKEPAASTNPGIVTVTIPEGYTRTQAAQLAKEDGLRGSYLKASKKSKLLNPAKYGGKGAKNLEGFLFPDTWELKSHTPAKDLVALQLQDFKKKIKHVNMKYANSKNLTIYDVLTIASIIEHESGTAGQRKLVAAVVYNRLHEGMTLGSDATVRYATGNFTKPLTQSQLESSSPYNTRIHPGLPPGPISNPGLAAIQAAAHPAKADYLFFVTSPDCKKLSFSATEAEFEQDVQRYEASKCTE